MTIRASLGYLTTWEPACIVPEDPGEVVRHAQPLDEHARRQIREQQIQRLLVAARYENA